MGMLAPDQVQAQLQQQQEVQPASWLMDDSVLLDLDLDMNDPNGDIGWNGWDDLVRDFQLETDNQLRDGEPTRGPAIGGMGNWW